MNVSNVPPDFVENVSIIPPLKLLEISFFFVLFCFCFFFCVRFVLFCSSFFFFFLLFFLFFLYGILPLSLVIMIVEEERKHRGEGIRDDHLCLFVKEFLGEEEAPSSLSDGWSDGLGNNSFSFFFFFLFFSSFFSFFFFFLSFSFLFPFLKR